MKLDHRYRSSIAPLLDPDERLLAAPRTGAWSSGAASESSLTGGAARLTRGRGVAGRLVGTAGLSSDAISLHDELVAATDRRLLFLQRRSRAVRFRASAVSAAYPQGDVSLSWADATIRNTRWRAFCFHLPDGTWWALETRLGTTTRSPRSDEADLMLEAFDGRAHRITLD